MAEKLAPIRATVNGKNEEVYLAVCRIQLGEKPGTAPGYQIQVLKKEGVRRYLTGYVGRGPVFENIAKVETPNLKDPDAIAEACKAKIKELIPEFASLSPEEFNKRVRIVIPQKAPKARVGSAVIARIFGKRAVTLIKKAQQSLGYRSRAIVTMPAGIIGAVLAGKNQGRVRKR